MNLSKVQVAALRLIQSDARFLFTLVEIHKNVENISTNYIMMGQPYIGVFVDGAEQWCKKVGLIGPSFNSKEKAYYTELRQGHKLFEKKYFDYSNMLNEKFNECNNYFYTNRSLIEKVCGYYNVGTDLCNGEFCGNTILCASYMPMNMLGNEQSENIIKEMSVIAGRMLAYLGCTKNLTYRYNDNLHLWYKDYHFYSKCPLKLRTKFGLELFSILCTINYVIVFIEKYFIEEIPQKFKFAYLQYYYLCDFIQELSAVNNIKLMLNDSLKNRNFRNCLAHYGLGQFLSENDIIEEDMLKGLTYKAFCMDYDSAKALLYKYLTELTEQIKDIIF